MKRALLLSMVAAAAASAAANAGRGAAAPTPCAAGSTMRPLIFGAHSTVGGGPPLAGIPVKVVFDWSNAADGTFDHVGSLEVSGPTGVQVSPGGSWNERLVTAPQAGVVQLELKWVQENSWHEQCSGTGAVSLRLREAKPARVRIWVRQRGEVEIFVGRGSDGDPAPVRLVVRSAGPRTRCCRGSQSWPPTPRPPKSGKALLDVQVPMAHRAGRNLSRRNAAVRAHLFDWAVSPYYYDLSVEPSGAYGPRFKRTTLAFAVDVFQSGRKIAWMSTGLRCLNRAGSAGGGLSCKWVGFRKGP